MRRSVSLASIVLSLLVQPAISHALPLISEVFYDALGSDNGRVFVEISGTPGDSLEGYTLEGVNGTNGAVGPIVVLSGVIPSDGLFVVADSSTVGVSEVPLADLIVNFDLQNGPDSLVLTDGEFVIDAVGYGIFSPGEVFAGEGAPVADPSAGWSIARVFADVDSDDNASDFEVLEVPTPGVARFQAVPEPGTGLLAGAGLITLGWIRRAGVRRGKRPPS